MIAVSELASRKRFKNGVVLRIWRCDDDRRRPRKLEQHTLERRNSRQFQMLNDFDRARRFETFKALVPIRERCLEKLDMITLSFRHFLHIKSIARDLQCAYRNIDAHYL